MKVMNQNNNNNRNRKVVGTTPATLQGVGGRLSVPIRLYPELGIIDPLKVKTLEDEENYYKSLLYGCRFCDIQDHILQVIIHRCPHSKDKELEVTEK